MPKIKNNKTNTLERKDCSKNDEEEEREWFQILAILLGSLSALTCGSLFSWPSPSIPKITVDKTNYDITSEEASYFTVLPPIGSIVSCLFFSKMIDKIGRKYTLLLSVVPQVLSLVLISQAKSVYVFYVSRFITGMADACLFAVLPTYIGEVATPSVRGTWGNAMTFCVYLGQLLINAVGSYVSITTTAYVCLTVPVLFVCTFAFMPETPYYYLMKGRYEDARKVLQKLRGKENVVEELMKLKSDVDRQMSESGTWKDLILIKSNRKGIYAGAFMRISQQLSGIACFSVYTQHIFLKAGGSLSASTSTLIFVGLCIVVNLIAAFVIDKFSRTKCYLYSSVLCGIVLFIETIYFFLDQNFPEIDVTVVNWIPVVGMVVYVTVYSFGIGIIPTLMTGELFSASIKSKGLCLVSIIMATSVSCITKLFHLLDSTIGLYAPFLLFSVSCFASTILSLYFVPDTRGKTLEEIQQSFKSKKVRKENDNNC